MDEPIVVEPVPIEPPPAPEPPDTLPTNTVPSRAADLRLVGEHEPELIEIPPGARTRINLATRSRRIE